MFLYPRSARNDSFLIPTCKKNLKKTTPNRRTILTFIELLQECLLRPTLRLQKNTRYMIRLLPTIHRLLELLPLFQQQHIDGARICDVSSPFEALSYCMSHICWRYTQCVQSNDFRSLNWPWETSLVSFKNTKTKLTERYHSRYNESARFRASAALGDVLVRVAKRAGIVVILVDRKQSSFSNPDRAFFLWLTQLQSLLIMVRGKGKNERIHANSNNETIVFLRKTGSCAAWRWSSVQ